MDKAITTALLIIAGVICMVFVFNSVYPMVNIKREMEVMIWKMPGDGIEG